MITRAFTRPLTLSLIVMAVIATIGIGSIVDFAYEQYTKQESTEASNNIDMIKAIGEQLAKTIESRQDKYAFVRDWQQFTPNTQYKYELKLETFTALGLPASLKTNMQNGESLVLETTDSISFYYSLGESGEVLVLKTASHEFSEEQDAINYLFTSLFYAGFVLLLLVWLYPLIKRLVSLANSARAFGQGDLSIRVNTSKPSYISEIEHEFNNMAQKIEDLVSDMKLLTSAVSHDLRTPLARIQFGVDTLSEIDDLDKRAKYEADINNDIGEMQRLVETLLQYARLDQHKVQLDLTPIDVSAFIQECIDNIEQNEHKQHRDPRITTHFPDYPIVVNIDPKYWRMLINNLLDNAVKYGNGEVKLSLTMKGRQLLISIADNGTGIDESILRDVFKPFIRGKHENKQGHGFGLAIVKRITELHGGSITVKTSDELLGAEFVLTLPLPTS